MGRIGGAPVAAADAEHRLSDPGEPLPGRWLIFGIMTVAMLMASVDQTIVSTALMAIQQDLNAPLTWSGWTITAYSLGQIIAMPLAGKLSDQIGRKKVLLVAVGVFTTASLCCGFAPNIYFLVALRAVQALGGGAFMPSATGIVADYFRRDRDVAMGMFISVFPIGGVLGPILGGFVVTEWSWRTIFLINVPLGVVLFTLAAIMIGPDERRRSSPIDLLGVTLLASMLLSAMYGLTNLGRGLGDPLFLVPEAIAIVLAALLVRHTLRHAAPFIPARLLFGRGFVSMNGLNLLFGGAILGFGAMIPLYAQVRYGLSPLESGTLLTARAVGMICVAGLATLALRRVGHRVPVSAGFAVLACGQVMISLAPPGQWSAYAWLAVATGVSGLGMGIALPAANNAGLSLAPDQLASIAGLRGMFRQSGAIIAISITTATVTASADPATAQAFSFLGFAALLLLAIPLIFIVPEHRGRW